MALGCCCLLPDTHWIDLKRRGCAGELLVANIKFLEEEGADPHSIPSGSNGTRGGFLEAAQALSIPTYPINNCHSESGLGTSADQHSLQNPSSGPQWPLNNFLPVFVPKFPAGTGYFPIVVPSLGLFASLGVCFLSISLENMA